MSNIEKKLPQPGQENWGNTLNKAIKDIDLGIEELKDRFDTEKIIAPRMFLSTGVVGEYGNGNNFFGSQESPFDDEVNFNTDISFSFDCYFSDTGEGESARILFAGEIPFDIVDSFTLPIGEMRFYPVYIFYNDGAPMIITKAEGAGDSEILSFSDIMISHPWYIYIGAIKGVNNDVSTSFTFIPQVLLSNQTVIEKMNSLTNPRIAVGDLPLIEDDGEIKVQPNKAIKYLFMSSGIGYAGSDGDRMKVDEKVFSYAQGQPDFNLFVMGAEGDVYRILLGNNGTVVLQGNNNGQVNNEEGEIRRASFDILNPTMVFGGYIEVGRFHIGKVEVIYKTQEGSLPAMAGSAAQLRKNNTLDEDDFALKTKLDGKFYGFDGLGVGLSADEKNPTKFILNKRLGTYIASGYDEETTFRLTKPFRIKPAGSIYDLQLSPPNLYMDNGGSRKAYIQISGTAEIIGTSNYKFKEDTISGERTFFLLRDDSDYLKFSSNLIDSEVEIQAPSYNATSDVRLKENLHLLNPAALSNLPLYTFTFKNDPASKQHVGILAQDLLEVAPELVEEHDGFYSIKESKLVYYLMNEVKNLTSTVASLEKRLTILEEQINENKKDK